MPAHAHAEPAAAPVRAPSPPLAGGAAPVRLRPGPRATAGEVLRLQRACGNGAVAAALRRDGAAVRRAIRVEGVDRSAFQALELIRPHLYYQQEEEEEHGVEYRRILRGMDLDGNGVFATVDALLAEVRRRRGTRAEARGGRVLVAPATVAQSLPTADALAATLGPGGDGNDEARTVRDLLARVRAYHAANLAYDAEPEEPEVDAQGGPLPVHDGYEAIPDGPQRSTPLEHDARNELRNATRLRLLGQVERLAYRWLGLRRANGEGADFDAVTDLVDAVQTAHREEIALLVDQEWDFVPEGPALDAAGLRDMARTWRTLVGSTGALTVTDQDYEVQTHSDFAREVHAAYARLLTTAAGRLLLTRILSRPNNRTVEIRNIPRNAAVGRHGGPEPAAAQPSHPVRAADPERGSSSVVGMVSDFSDTELWAVDADGNPILTPAWLALGHELIHALHDMQGVNAFSSGVEVPDGWSNLEEANTIGLVSAQDVPEMSLERMRQIVMDSPENGPLQAAANQALATWRQAHENAEPNDDQRREILRTLLTRELSLTENGLRAEAGLTRRVGHGGDWRGAPEPQDDQPLVIASLEENRRADYEEI